MAFGRNRFRPIVKTDKHEISWSNLAQNASSTISIVLVTGVATPLADADTEVEIGNHVKSIYFEFHFSPQVITNPKVIHWEVLLRPQGVVPASATPSLYYQNGRNLIIKRGMEMLPANTGTVFKRIFVVRIPKKAMRIAEGDSINFRYISSSAETINACGIAIYKEWK